MVEKTREKSFITINDIVHTDEVSKLLNSEFELMLKAAEEANGKELELAKKAGDENKIKELEDQLENLNNMKFDDYLNGILYSGEFQFQYDYGFKGAISTLIDVIPIIGDIKGMTEAFFGVDFITGRELGIVERSLCGLSAIPFFGDGLAMIKAGKGWGKVFIRELGENAMAMGVSLGAQELGANPLVALALYQGYRIKHKNSLDTIGKALSDNEIPENMKMAKNSFKNTLNSKLEAITELTSDVKADANGNIIIKLKKEIEGVSEIVFRKEELTPFQRYACFNGCFTGDTLVMTKEGLKRIDSIKEGEYLLARCDRSEEIAYKKVLHTMKKVSYEFTHLNIAGETIKATPNHLFKTEIDGWKAAEEIQVGEGIIDSNGEIKYVEGKEKLCYDEGKGIYNLEVEDFHTYYVGECGVLVHNKYNNPNLNKIYKNFFDDYIPDEATKGKLKGLLDKMDELGDEDLIRKFDDEIYGIVNGKNVGKLDADQLSSVNKLVDKYNGNYFSKGVSNSKEPRYVGRKISNTLYRKLRSKTPSKKIQDMVNENIDNLTGTLDPALGKPITDRFEADHIVSYKKITEMEGFEKLTELQQIEVINNSENFVGLTKSANTSKGSKSFTEWVTYKKENIKINPEFRAKMIAKEKQLEIILQKQIDDYINLNKN